ncbi:MAG TPA: DedA family protein [Bacillota bacterium]|nr:DedA family protein [Bacillota bacterium]
MSVMADLTRFATGLVQGAGAAGVFVGMTIESVGIPLPSEVIMPLGGALATGRAALVAVILAGTAGNLAGSLLAYAIGRGGGARWLKPRHLEAANHWFKRYGPGAVFFGRILPVVRTYISFPAGSAAMALPGFIAYTVAGSLIWSAALAYAGYRLRASWAGLADAIAKAAPVIAVVAILIIVWAIFARRRRATAE